MKLALFLLISTTGCFLSCQSQTNDQAKSKAKPAMTGLSGMAATANKFLVSLSKTQKSKAQFDFDDSERYNWHFVPKSRKGLPLKEMSESQYAVAMDLLRMTLSDTGFQKTTDIIHLEGILREVEGRPTNDDYRDPGKYYFSVFGNPATDSIWGWRLEGHHISFNFSAKNNTMVSGTPGFLGTNPAIVLSGPEKGKYILKNETELGLGLLRSLDAEQSKKAIIDDSAPADIITGNSRKAMIENPRGILYNELTTAQQALFMQLLSIYIHRYTRLFAKEMMNEIETAGLNNLRFAWAGSQQSGPGNPHYYRVQGPTIIIEYDNTQNNANHIHTVIRDLKNDFGGDELLEHYKNTRH
jgi:hypothetical protein